MAYVIAPRTDAWLIPILNTLGMTYLTYCAVAHSSAASLGRTTDIPLARSEPEPIPDIEMSRMREVCRQATDYAISSRSYLHPDL